MDYDWAEKQLQDFVDLIEAYRTRRGVSEEQLIERSAAVEPIVRRVRPNASWMTARRGYTYTFDPLREEALKALGLLRAHEDHERHMGPTGPQLAAANLHPWVWEPVASMWDTGYRRVAVQTAATSVDVHLQAKLGRSDPTGTALVREAFTRNAPDNGKPRLRFGGDRDTQTWRDRQDGARDFGTGCFLALRNPATHGLDELPEQEALEQLAALSLLARWIDECSVATAP